ncbi:MAG TPA: TetR/AcrR family transcriptional regulator [Clostridiales bacterium]|nr:TetR/AcrR family transcriptional regulator [Clostridiales bacterium]
MNKSHMSSTRNQLILAGLEELTEHGVGNFSTRRVAKKCGISCAAPYKHFRNTQEFIAEILGYINEMYYEQQDKTLEKYKDCGLRKQLIEISLDYIRFLVKYPEFRRVIMQSFKECDENYRCLRGQLSERTYKIVSEYCQAVDMPEDVRRRKTFIIRSIVYGAALFFDNGEMEYTEENMDMVASMIEREFELP